MFRPWSSSCAKFINQGSDRSKAVVLEVFLLCVTLCFYTRCFIYKSLLYKSLKGKARIPTDDLIPKTKRGRNQHSMTFQTPIASTDAYKGSFFPQIIRDGTAFPDSLISSA